MDSTIALARSITVNPTAALRMTRRLLHEGSYSRIQSLFELPAAILALTHRTRGYHAAVSALLERRAPLFSRN